MAYLAEGLQVITTYQQEGYKSVSVRLGASNQWYHWAHLHNAQADFEYMCKLIRTKD